MKNIVCKNIKPKPEYAFSYMYTRKKEKEKTRKKTKSTNDKQTTKLIYASMCMSM